MIMKLKNQRPGPNGAVEPVKKLNNDLERLWNETVKEFALRD
jgi:hypothetical protein